jgi:imidazolonepropionase-like amidohydrolase
LTGQTQGDHVADAAIAITGGYVVPVTDDPIDGGTVLIRDGRIAAVGRDLEVPADATVIDAGGRWVLPGFVEAHGHVGVHEEGEGWAGADSNELTEPVTAHVRALDAINPADLGFRDAIGGGVLAVNVNPGSGNPIGGQTAAVKCWGRTVDEMLLRAPAGMKSALGENPKRVYGDRKQQPATRLGTAAVIRGALVDAANYLARLDAEERKPEADRKPVDRDLKLEALGGSCGAKSRGASIVTALTTSPLPSGWPTSSATSWSSITAPRRTCSPTCWPLATFR